MLIRVSHILRWCLCATAGAKRDAKQIRVGQMKAAVCWRQLGLCKTLGWQEGDTWMMLLLWSPLQNGAKFRIVLWLVLPLCVFYTVYRDVLLAASSWSSVIPALLNVNLVVTFELPLWDENCPSNIQLVWHDSFLVTTRCLFTSALWL